MLALVLGVIALLVVFGIAAVVVGRETHRLVEDAPRPVFDLDEAVDFVAANVPFEVSAELSHDDVRQILTWSLERLSILGASSNGHGAAPSGPAVVATGETVDHILARAREARVEYPAAHIHAVLHAQLAYLEMIGALGPPESPPDR